MKLGHKKRVLSGSPELTERLHLSYFYNVNSTPDGRWLQWL